MRQLSKVRVSRALVSFSWPELEPNGSKHSFKPRKSIMFRTLALLAVVVAVVVENPIATRIVFNNGLPEAGQECLAIEWKLVKAAVVNATLTGRQRCLGERDMSRHLGKSIGCDSYSFMIGCPPEACCGGNTTECP
jgi:hypothetical protein